MADMSSIGNSKEMCDVSPLAAVVLSGNFPVITKNILSFLPARSLNNSASVCQLWRKLSSEIQNNRCSLSWMLHTNEEDNDESTSLASEIQQYLESLWCEPSVILAYITTNLFEEQLVIPSKSNNSKSTRGEYSRAAKCGKTSLQDYVAEKLPKSCQFLGVAADGTVGTQWGSPKSMESESTWAMTMLTLPQIKGVDVFSFTMDIYSSDTRWHTSIDDLHASEVDITAISGIPEDKCVKAVLFFCDEPFCPPEIGYSLMRKYEDAVVAGGYVDSLVLPANKTTGDTDATILCVAFCGENLKVASVLIRENVRTASEAEKQITKLKDCQFAEEKSFAFMFACVGRGEGLYGKANVEADAFRKIFPKTPLFGFFGNGEIGYNHIPKPSDSQNLKTNTEEMNSSKRILPKLYHAYTTVLCLFSMEG